MLFELQKKTAVAIVNIFETGRVLGDYSALATLPGDTGHLSYGRSQATLGSGNLHRLIQAYCNTPGATFAAQLSPYLERLQQRDSTLDTDVAFRGFLRQAAGDLVMHTVQDQFFDANYWSPAALSATGIGISSALGTSVVYDSHVQGGWGVLRDRTLSQFGTPGGLGENDWVSHYVSIRRDWLATNSNPVLRPTVYRMDSYLVLIQESRFDLALPIVVRGITIDAKTLAGGVPPRALRLTTPPMTGDDVRALQEALMAAGATLAVDGVFGPPTDAAVRQFQQQQGLIVDGNRRGGHALRTGALERRRRHVYGCHGVSRVEANVLGDFTLRKLRIGLNFDKTFERRFLVVPDDLLRVQGMTMQSLFSGAPRKCGVATYGQSDAMWAEATQRAES